MRAAGELAQLGANRFAIDDAARHRLHEVTAFLERACERVDEQRCASDQRIVALAHLRREGADQIDVRAVANVAAAHQRLARRRCAAAMYGASAPVPTITRCEASSRDR